MQKVIREGAVRKVFIISAISATCMVCLKQHFMFEHINQHPTLDRFWKLNP